MKKKVAVILTCFNRKEMTLRCLRQLSDQTLHAELDFFICDDASKDGTYEAIEQQFPNVHLQKSEGNLYWSKGMYVAMLMATKEPHDLYLMVNDDVNFFPYAIDRMIKVYDDVGCSCGIVGMTKSKESGEITYGGRINIPFQFGKIKWGVRENKLVIPELEGKYMECDVANWNCFMVDEEVVSKVGLIDSRYEHSIGDYDYTLRMKHSGYKIFIVPEIIGYCERNSREGTFYDKNLPRKERFKQLIGAKGMPLKSYYLHAYKENGILGLFIMTWRYVQLFKCIFLKRNIGS